MSVYRPKKSPFYAYDFQLDGRRFQGTTKLAGRRDALRFEAVERENAKALLAAERAVAGGPLTLEAAAARYWSEVGRHHAGAKTTLRNAKRIIEFLGAGVLLSAITDDDVARMVAWRRSHTVKNRDTVRDPADRRKALPAPTISASTVNRSTIEPLQKLFNRARRVWKIRLPDEPEWRVHLLREPRERVREVRAHEEDALEAAVRPDYLPLVRFARAAGLRLAECLLQKSDVDLHAGRVRTRGKGGKRIDQPITLEMRGILMTAMANPTAAVFTYAAARAKAGAGGHAKGARLPITSSGLKTMWRRSRSRKAGPSLPADLRFHDLRHDFATKLLRETRNLKLVQKALHHAKVETTTRYAHVLDEEVLAGMEAASQSRKKSRTAGTD